MGGANNMPIGGGNNGFFGGNANGPSSGNTGWGGKGTNQNTGYNPQATMSYNAPTQQMLYAPSTPIPQNVQAKYAPQQNYRNTPMSIPAPTASSGGFNLGDIGSILSRLFGGGGQSGQGFPTQPTTNRPPQLQGNTGYIQPPVLPSMVGPEAINNAPTAAPTINRAPIVQAPPTPPPAAPIAAPASDPSYSPYNLNEQTGLYQDSSGKQIAGFYEDGSPQYIDYGYKRGGFVKTLTDEVDRALSLVRGVVKKDKK